MQEDLQHFKAQKQRRKRLLTILVISILMALTTVFIQECNQNFDEPYNKGYQPLDQTR